MANIHDGIHEVKDDPRDAPASSIYDGVDPSTLRSMAAAITEPDKALEILTAATDGERKPTAGTAQQLLEITPVFRESGNLYEEIEREEAKFKQYDTNAGDLKSHKDERAALEKVNKQRIEYAAKVLDRFEEKAAASNVGPALKPSEETRQLCEMDEYARKNFHPQEYASYIRNMRRLYPGWAATFQTPSLNRQLAHPSPWLKGYEKTIRQAMRDVPLMDPYEAQEHIQTNIEMSRKLIRGRLRKMVASGRRGSE